MDVQLVMQGEEGVQILFLQVICQKMKSKLKTGMISMAGKPCIIGAIKCYQRNTQRLAVSNVIATICQLRVLKNLVLECQLLRKLDVILVTAWIGGEKIILKQALVYIKLHQKLLKIGHIAGLWSLEHFAIIPGCLISLRKEITVAPRIYLEPNKKSWR